MNGRQTPGTMPGDDEATDFTQAPQETFPRQPTHLFRAIEKQDVPVADARINHLLHHRRKARGFLGKSQANRSEAEVTQFRFEVLEQSGFAGPLRSHDGSAIAALFQLFEEILPGPALKPVADVLKPGGGERIIACVHGRERAGQSPRRLARG